MQGGVAPAPKGPAAAPRPPQECTPGVENSAAAKPGDSPSPCSQNQLFLPDNMHTRDIHCKKKLERHDARALGRQPYLFFMPSEREREPRLVWLPLATKPGLAAAGEPAAGCPGLRMTNFLSRRGSELRRRAARLWMDVRGMDRPPPPKNHAFEGLMM